MVLERIIWVGSSEWELQHYGHAALLGVARFDLAYRHAILAAFAVLFAVSAAGIAQLEVDSNFMTEFSKEEPIRIATEYVDRTMGGSQSLVYLFESYLILLPSILMAVFITLLEILVAFLQAYVFTFLSIIFVSMAIHPDH